MRRAPARPVRACFVRSCCGVVVQEHDLRASQHDFFCGSAEVNYTQMTLPQKQNSSHSSICHANIVVSSFMSNPTCCATSMQKPFSRWFLQQHIATVVYYQEFDNSFLDSNGRQTPETAVEDRLQRLSCTKKVQNTKGATAYEIAAPKPELDATTVKRRFCSTFQQNFQKEDFEALFNRTFKRKITSAKKAKIC